MEYKDNKFLYFIIITLIVILISGFIFLAFYLLKDIPEKPNNTSSLSSEVTPNISKIIEEIKSANSSKELIYETQASDGIISLIYKKNTKDSSYENILINPENGKQITFKDLIKNDYWSCFETKELELLNLKYPEFIVNIILSNKENLGKKEYIVKKNEVIIYYKGYDTTYREELSLKINYNEIRPYLNFQPTFDTEYQNENGYNYTKTKKAIALTFDDGPSSKYNSLILKELEKNKAHATFFMIGQMMNSCQNCVLDTYKSGNEIGSHTYDHLNISTNNNERIFTSLDKTNTLYKNITGDTIKYLRPPYGAYNKRNLENISAPFILWDMDTEDWRYRNVEHIVNYIKENAHDGGIILMHELYESSYESLKIILPWLYEQGYQVVSITELANLKEKNLTSGKAYGSLR